MQMLGEDGGYVVGRPGWIGIEHVDSGATEFLDVQFLYLQLRVLSVNYKQHDRCSENPEHFEQWYREPVFCESLRQPYA